MSSLSISLIIPQENDLLSKGVDLTFLENYVISIANNSISMVESYDNDDLY